MRSGNATVSLRGPLLGLAAITPVILAITAFSQWSTTKATNELDLERSSTAVQHAIQSQISHIESVADDNANWDDAAIALYRPRMDADFAWRGFGAVTVNAKIYETMFVIDGTGRQAIAFEDGHTITRDLVKTYGKPFANLAAEAKRKGSAVGGILQVGAETRIVGVAVVTPTSTALKRELAHRPPILVAFASRLSPSLLSGMAIGLQLDGLSLVKSPTEASIPLSDPSGRIVGYLGWKPGDPGFKAFKKATPMLGLALLMRALALALVLSYCLRFYREIRHTALHDSLSNLPNRRLLEEEVTKYLKREQQVAVCFLDLDGFKAVNDNYGHSVGDELIRKCAETALELANNCKMVARLGGDEFAVMATGPAAGIVIERFAERLLRRFATPFRLGERTILVGASAGMAESSADAEDIAELMRRADIAMYAAKHSGKMQMKWYTPELDQAQADVIRIDQQMRRGLELGHFHVHYQPLVDARTYKVETLEALLRWSDPDAPTPTPDRFVPVAEETGLIDRIGLFVLETACRDALEWGNAKVAVNVSAAQLRNPLFPKQLREILAKTGLRPSRLELEITETYIVLDTDMAVGVLHEMHKLGVGIALDDFGTGYASIGFLRQFQFDALKIDRSLVVDAVREESARALVHASIVVARALGMSVVAEGIENEAQAHFMRVAGCDLLQGWLFAKAVSASEVPDLMRSIAGRTETPSRDRHEARKGATRAG